MPRRRKETPRQSKVHRVLSEFKRGELHSGSKTGPKVKSRKQAIAIGMSEARKREGRERRLERLSCASRPLYNARR